jgi:hypothetical protein
MGRTLKEPGQSRALSLPTRRPPAGIASSPAGMLSTSFSSSSSRTDAQQHFRHRVGDLLLDPGCAGSAGRVRHGAEARVGSRRVQGRCVRVDPVLPCSDDRLRCGCPRIDRLKVPVDDPRRFSRSREGGAHFGLTPREHSSDELIYQGRIGKRRDPEAPALLLAG